MSRYAVTANWLATPTTAHPAGSRYVVFAGTRKQCDAVLLSLGHLGNAGVDVGDADPYVVYLFDKAKGVLDAKVMQDTDYRLPDPAKAPVTLPEVYNPGSEG